MDFNELIDKAEQKINGFMDEATVQCKSALNDLNNRVNGPNQPNPNNMNAGYQQAQHEQGNQPMPDNNMNQSSIINGEGFNDTKQALSQDTAPEVNVKSALNLEKENTPVTLAKTEETPVNESMASVVQQPKTNVNLDKTPEINEEQPKTGINLKK